MRFPQSTRESYNQDFQSVNPTRYEPGNNSSKTMPRKDPHATKPEPALNHQPLAAAGTILTPHTPNPSTQKHVHHNTLLLSLATNAWWSLSIQKFLLSGAALIQKTSGGAAPQWGGPATLSQAKLRQTLETNQAMSRTASATASATRVSKAPGMM